MNNVNMKNLIKDNFHYFNEFQMPCQSKASKHNFLMLKSENCYRTE